MDLAEQAEVWGYIDPDPKEPKKLVKPTEVKPRLFVGEKAKLPPLTDEELQKV